MIKITNLTMRNFLSFGNVTSGLKLDKAGMTLVLGSNSDVNGGISRNGAGKAQPLWSKIKTPTGWTTMGDIKEGDIVSTPDGGRANVISLFPQGKKDIYRITFADGRTAEACGDHLWKVWHRTGKWKYDVLDTNAIIKKIEKNTPSSRIYVPLIESMSSESIELPLDPKFLGILIGDGTLGKSTMISSVDEETLNYMKSNLIDGYTIIYNGGCDYRISKIDNKNGKCRKNLFNNEYRKILHDLGLQGKKSYEKFIPNIYKQASVAQKIKLIQGLMDTDGTVDRNGSLTYSTTSHRLAEDLVEVIRSIGGISSIKEKQTSYVYKNKRKTGRLSYTVKIRYKNPRDLVSLRRKISKISEKYQYADTLRLEVKSIEYVGQHEAQCIMIDHSEHLYITDNYVVTHNTSMAQAISYALYGKPLSKIKLPNLVNNINNKGMCVTLEFETNGIKYRVERGKKPDFMRFYVNNVELKSAETDDAQGENGQTQQTINRVVGMSHNMFKNIVIMNTSSEAFLKMPVSAQREIIEELLGVTQISQRAEHLKKLRDSTKESLRDEQATLKATQEANSKIEDSIKKTQILSGEWKRDHDKHLAEISDQIDALSSVNYDAELIGFDIFDKWTSQKSDIANKISNTQKEIALLDRELSTLNTNIRKLDVGLDFTNDATVMRLRSEIERATKARLKNQDLLQKINKELLTVDENLLNSDKQICTCCGQMLTGTDHHEKVIDNMRKQRLTMIAEIQEVEEDIVENEAHIKHVNEEIEAAHLHHTQTVSDINAQIDAHKEEVVILLEAKSELLKQIAEWNDTISSLPQPPKLIFSSRDEVYKTKQLYEGLIRELEIEMTKINPHDQNLEILKSTLSVISYDAVNDLENLQKHQEFLLKLLTSKDSFIRKKIIDQNISYLNSRIAHYLDKLGFPNEVKFQSDLSVEISLLGRDFDFEQLSRGEQNRVIMATSWSFRDVWESLNDGFNLLFVDELLDQGMDAQGVEAALAVLKGMVRERAKNVFLISHREELTARINNTLIVKKEAGFTSLIEE